ncbi:hypothetical protein E2L08_15555 [Palleronia sediminis]|uniref:Uncharacterized protein n=1 Tax=Palleronia sediminis TaxID=2547833 RepID=A0A4R6A1Y4_9RHOB|nr:hypothetical protein [Palleronia sediminis]TDL75016.1 hypothetical protein E2L08_15555 [Palleronia sediminis]
MAYFTAPDLTDEKGGSVKQVWGATLGASVGLVAIVAIWMQTGAPGGLASESGPLEWWSWVLLGWATVLWLVNTPPRRWIASAYVPFVLFTLFLRESPYGPWVFDEQVFAARFYTAEGLSIRSVAGGLYAFWAGLAVISLILRGPAALAGAWGARAPWFVIFVAAGCCAVAAQLAEALSDGISAQTTLHAALVLVEEGLEAVFALGLLIAVALGTAVETRQAPRFMALRLKD